MRWGTPGAACSKGWLTPGVSASSSMPISKSWRGGPARPHASMHQIHGPGLSANYLGNLMTVSSVEAPSATRLFNLWIEQKLGSDANVRVGQYAASQEFAISENANLFVNSAFGWPFLSSENLPSGGPNYPEGTTGVRLKVT